MSNINREQAAMGQELHRIEATIYTGRQAIRELVGCEPVDEAAVELHRQHIHEARLVRNTLKGELEKIKLQQAPPYGLHIRSWYVGG